MPGFFIFSSTRGLDVLGRDRELAAGVVRGELLDELGAALGEVVAHAATR